jgi:hypothetical protein
MNGRNIKGMMDYEDIDYREKQSDFGHELLVYGITILAQSRPAVYQMCACYFL